MNGNDNEFRASYAQARTGNEVDRAQAQMRESVHAFLESVYGGIETESGEFRGNYILIDGKPATSYVERYYEESRVNRDPDLQKRLVDDLIISACLQGRRVDCVMVDPGDFSVKAENIEAFPGVYVWGDHIPENVRAEIGARMNPGTIALDPRPANVEEAVRNTTELLARRSHLMVEKSANLSAVHTYLMRDISRDILGNRDWNPDGTKTMYELTGEVKENVGMTLHRTAFISHVIGMMVLEGHSIDEIYDPVNGADLRADAGRRFYEMCRNGEREAVVRLNVRIAQKINTVLDEELGKIDFSDPAVYHNETVNRLAALAGMNFDMKQERMRNNENTALACKILAAQNGRDLSEPGAQEESRKALDTLNANVVNVGHIRIMPQGYKDALDGMIGLKTPKQLDKTNIKNAMVAEIWRKDISAAQKNGQPVSSLFTDVYVDGSYNLSVAYSSQDDDTLLKDRYDELCDYETPEELRKFCSDILDGTFARENVAAFIKVDSANTLAILKKREPGVTTKYEHADHDPEFWGGTFVNPANKEFPSEEQRVTSMMHRFLFTNLQKRFDISVRGGQDRLYMIDENGSLVSLAEKDFTRPENQKLARDLASSGRLFAVRPDETAPVQVNVRQVENPGHTDPKFEMTAADGLDAPPRKVTYRFYHALGAMLGIQSCLDRKAAYEKEEACSRFRESMNRIKDERAEKVTYEALHERNERAKQEEKEKELGRVNIEAKDRDLAFRTIGEYYGPHPKFHEEYVPSRCYTKEEFDTLKDYELGLAQDPPIGTPPAMKDGKAELREADFAALAMAAASRHQVTGDFRRGNGEDHPEESGIIVTDSNSTMYLEDLALTRNADGTGMLPRQGIGKYIPKSVAPARDIAADAVKEYQKGNRQPIARLIADGLAAANRTQMHGAGFSAKEAAVQKYFGAFGDMMKADPELGQLVREAGKEIVREAKEERAKNAQAYQNYKNQHEAHLKSVEDTLAAQNQPIEELYQKINGTSISMAMAVAAKDNEKIRQVTEEKKNLEEQVKQLHEAQREYFSKEENKDFYSLVVQGANHLGIDKHYEMDSRLDVDQTVQRLEEKRRVTEVFEAGTQAKAALQRAKLNGEELSPETKTRLMKAVFKSELIRRSNAGEQASVDSAVNSQTEKIPEICRLVDGNARPARRAYDSKLDTQDNAEATNFASFANKVRQMYHYANQTDPISQLSHKLVHPVTGDRAFDEVFPQLYSKADKMEDMNVDTLLDDIQSNKVETTVKNYMKNLAAGNQNHPQITDPSLAHAAVQSAPNANNADLSRNNPAENRSIV